MAEHNGAAPRAPDQPQPSLDAQVDAQLRQVLGIMTRGILISAPGIPPDVIAKSMMRIMGEIIGQAIVGTLPAVLTIRKECKEAFADALGRQPVVPTPTGLPQKLHA